MKNYFVTGIGTGIGKTIVSAILTEALEADYWKPIQAGNLDNTDTDVIKFSVSNTQSKFHPETFKLTQALSPHAAANIDGIEINIDDIILPRTNNNLIIEGAGGLMVPINNKGDLVIDLIKKLNAPVILVSKNYLGSINHTLLSIEALKNRNIPIAGIVFNGEDEFNGEEFILKYSQLKCFARIKSEDKINKETVLKYKNNLNHVGT
ncbi:MAG: dethiobiotin synthase [Bacteroidetes bacterium RIFCSPLOWO2_12_FULL_31_6]|nr:MAG: dethiobiotin synthase [Bacteroidetes bacterium RIFCSPLOWO2_12_FULL_31_6]